MSAWGIVTNQPYTKKTKIKEKLHEVGLRSTIKLVYRSKQFKIQKMVNRTSVARHIATARVVRTTPNAETLTCQSLPLCLACGNGFAELPSAFCLLL